HERHRRGRIRGDLGHAISVGRSSANPDTPPPCALRERDRLGRMTSVVRSGGTANKPPLSATLRRIERHAGKLASAAVAQMDETLPWFRALPADQRSWVMLVAQAGVRSLVEWLRSGGTIAPSTQEISDEVFAAAPRALARSITLTQTVALIKVTIDVAEAQVSALAADGEEEALTTAILKFSREIAFSAARVYARAAESRGAWAARAPALLGDRPRRWGVGGRPGGGGGGGAPPGWRHPRGAALGVRGGAAGRGRGDRRRAR